MISNTLADEQHEIIAEVKSSDSLTIPANSTISASFNVTKYGYTPMGIIGIRVTTAKMNVVEYYVDSTNANCIIRNLDSSSIEGAFVRTRILYKSN